MLGRFQREAKLAVRLKHPNVVRSFQVGQYKGLHYLVMEYVEGETLDVVLQRRKKLPVNEAVRLVHQCLQGLQHIHEQQMVHRDLRPTQPAPPGLSARGLRHRLPRRRPPRGCRTRHAHTARWRRDRS